MYIYDRVNNIRYLEKRAKIRGANERGLVQSLEIPNPPAGVFEQAKINLEHRTADDDSRLINWVNCTELLNVSHDGG